MAQGSQRQPSVTPVSPAVGAFGYLDANYQGTTVSAPAQVSEYFVVQCFFPSLGYTVHYLVTNTNRIIAVDPVSGQWMQVGWANPPRLPGVAWSFDTLTWHLAVMPNGVVLAQFPPYGNFGPIGSAVRLF